MQETGRPVDFAVTVSEEILGDAAPVLFQGGIVSAIGAAARVGYDAVELHVRDPRTLDATAIRSAARDAGVRIAAIGTGLEYSKNGLSFTSDDSVILARTHDRFREHIEFAAEFAPDPTVVFVGLCRGVAPSYALCDEYLRRFHAALVPIVEFATEAGVTLVLEPVAYYFSNLLNTTAESIEFLRLPGLKPVDLLLDTHHMFLEDPDLGDAFRLAAGRVSYIHFSDSNRRSPGAGNIDFLAAAEAIVEIGYHGTVSIEVSPFPDGPTAAKNSIAELHRVFAR